MEYIIRNYNKKRRPQYLPIGSLAAHFALYSNPLDTIPQSRYTLRNSFLCAEFTTIMMTVFSIIIRSGISLALIALTAFTVGAMMQPRPIPQHTGSVLPPNSVEVVPIQRHEDGINFDIDGEVVPFRRVDIISEIAGRVIYKSENCRSGKTVQQGEVLMRIDPVDYQLAADQAEAAMKQAQASIAENEVQRQNTEKELGLAKEHVELSQRDYDRNKQLADSKTITPADLDTVQQTLLSSQESVQKLQNQLRVYETQAEKLKVSLKKEELALRTAELNIERTEVKAPITGVVTADVFEVNTYIQKGTDIAKILDTAQLEIQCSLYMKQIQWIWRQAEESNGYVFPPTPVSILLEIDGNHWVWEGELRTIDGGIMNAATRMVPCRVKVDDPQSAKKIVSFDPPRAEAEKNAPPLFAGMYVKVVVHSKPSIPLYRIPERALLPGNRIWTVEKDGTLRQHSIRIATTTPQKYVLFYADSEKVQANDFVVVSPLASPQEGSKVQTVQQVAEKTETETATAGKPVS
ncbi:MAG: HlyD family efflux transporter periplasmic adaptor subunit [Planctomycetaceae bacterium]|nr:HlyD family efflux transporter periplasmic adaptor subunit [Planctomycetaceae bacterium]